MSATVRLDYIPSGEQQQWLVKHVGPRLHYIHNSIGGEGWVAKRKTESTGQDGMLTYKTYWELTFENDSFASWFTLSF
jgi:hypothetical protein